MIDNNRIADYAPVASSWLDRFCKYSSTIFKPHSSFTTVIGAGTSSWNVSSELPDPLLFANSFLAARIASLTAQWTDDARTTAGSPEAGSSSSKLFKRRLFQGQKKSYCIKEIITLLPLEESTRFLWYPVFSTSALNCFGMVSTLGIL